MTNTDYQDLILDLALDNLDLLVRDDPAAVMTGVGRMLETRTGLEQTRVLESVLRAARHALASPAVENAVLVRWQTLIRASDGDNLPGCLARLLEIQRIACGQVTFENALADLHNSPLEGRILAQWLDVSAEGKGPVVAKMRLRALRYMHGSQQWRSLTRALGFVMQDCREGSETVVQFFQET